VRIIFVAILMVTVGGFLSAQRQSDNPGDLQAVLLIDGSHSFQMKDAVASRSGRLGITANKQYFSFGGPKATLRTRNAMPTLQFDADPDFDDPVYLFRLDVRSDRREIRIAKGHGLTELTIPKDHMIPTRQEEIGKGQNSTTRYQIKPTVPLRSGEYCLSRRVSVCFDFGVD
jgi:hypothetical protein